MYNNIAVATGKGGDAEAIFGSNGATLGNNVTNNTGTIDFWVDAAGTNPDFHLKSTAAAIIGQGTTTEAPKEDIGFDPKCITKKPPLERTCKAGGCIPSISTTSKASEASPNASTQGPIRHPRHRRVRPVAENPLSRFATSPARL